MIELKVTKSKMVDYLRVFGLVLSVCDKFIITNDIIQPVDLKEGSVTGAHRIKHPLFPVTQGRVFQSVGNIKDIIREITDKKGVGAISIVNTDTSLLIRMDYDEYILAMSSETTDSTRMFEDIVNEYILNHDHFDYPRDVLTSARFGEVVSVGNDEFGTVRLSKSSFPFIGVSRATDETNFTGKYILGVYDEALKENYIASYMKYKRCEAFHMYVYIPFNE